MGTIKNLHTVLFYWDKKPYEVSQYMKIKYFVTIVQNIEQEDIENINAINDFWKSFDIILTIKQPN